MDKGLKGNQVKNSTRRSGNKEYFMHEGGWESTKYPKGIKYEYKHCNFLTGFN